MVYQKLHLLLQLMHLERSNYNNNTIFNKILFLIRKCNHSLPLLDRIEAHLIPMKRKEQLLTMATIIKMAIF